MDVNLAIAVTANQGVYPEDFVMALDEMIKPEKYKIFHAGEHIKSGSLNRQVQHAGEADCTHILFLDVDMVHPKWTIPRLLSHRVPIVSGLYHLKSEPFSPICGWFDEHGESVNGAGYVWKKHYYPMPRNQLVEVSWCGIGCLLVDMEVFDKIRFPPFFDIWDREKGKRSRGHDVILCDLARAAGYKVYVDTAVDCGHIGRVMVNGIFVEAMHNLKLWDEMIRIRDQRACETAYWDQRWTAPRIQNAHAFNTALISKIHEMVPFGASVADLGCGDGVFIKTLSRSKGCSCVGYDFSTEAINFLADYGIPGKVVDFKSYTPDPSETYHTVICSHTLEHFSNEELPKVLDTLSRMTEYQAIVVVPDGTDGDWYEHRQEFTEESLKEVLKPYFSWAVEVHRVGYNKDDRVSHLIVRCYA